MTRITGVIFSDLGRAASFMALAAVQRALRESLGFAPFPATLNVRPQDTDDSATWSRLRAVSAGRPLAIAEPGFCSARLAAFKVPSQWEVTHHPLPRNAAGKIMKNVLSGESDTRLTEE